MVRLIHVKSTISGLHITMININVTLRKPLMFSLFGQNGNISYLHDLHVGYR